MTHGSLSRKSESRSRRLIAFVIMIVAAALVVGSAPSSYAVGNTSGSVALTAAQKSIKTSGKISGKRHVVGKGTKKSCTTTALIKAIRKGGTIVFRCGKKHKTIKLSKTIAVPNSIKTLVIDGGGKITLSGNKKRRIFYVDTCDRSLGKVSGNCLYSPKTPRITLQNLTFADGNASKASYVRWDGRREREGGGAIFALGGQLTVIKSTFIRNRCQANGPDIGGGAIRVLAQSSPTPNDLDSSYAARRQHAVQIVASTFGGKKGRGNSCANGGAISTLRTPLTVTNSRLSYNAAVGCCSNPAKAGTPGGGSGGATYSDGNSYTTKFAGSRIERNTAKAGGSAIFYVSNDRSGHLVLDRTVSRYNRYVRSKYGDQHFQNYPGIFYLGNGAPIISRSTVR